MKKLYYTLALTILISSLSSCSLFNNLFGKKEGCPSNGKNVGAEKLLGGDAETQKAVKKAKKFKS